MRPDLLVLLHPRACTDGVAELQKRSVQRREMSRGSSDANQRIAKCFLATAAPFASKWHSSWCIQGRSLSRVARAGRAFAICAGDKGLPAYFDPEPGFPTLMCTWGRGDHGRTEGHARSCRAHRILSPVERAITSHIQAHRPPHTVASLSSHTVAHNPIEWWHALTHFSAQPSTFTAQLALLGASSPQALKRTGPWPQ